MMAAALSPKSTASSQTSPSEDRALLDLKARGLNEREGNLKGYRCSACKNRGYFSYFDDGGELKSYPCRCMKVRRSLRHIRDSGLAPLLDTKTFDTYQTPELWHKYAKESAMRYLQDDTGAWLVMAGSNGAGKTHLCTAVCGEFLKRGLDVRYMLWLDESGKLKAAKTDETYSQMMDTLKRASVLYIDDLFKVKRGAEITDADVRLAFEIINFRSIDQKKRTIISSEKRLEEIVNIDQGLGGRIREKSRGFYVSFSGRKDWRLR